jgi:hypothetical protein
MSAVVRRATRLSGTFAVLTGGSNDDLHKTCKCNARSCAAPRARKPLRLTYALCLPACDWAPRVEGSQPVRTCLRGTSEA